MGRHQSVSAEHVRKDEAISVEPARILRIERHELVEENMSSGGLMWSVCCSEVGFSCANAPYQSHWGTRMARIALEGRIDGEEPDGVDGELVNLIVSHICGVVWGFGGVYRTSVNFLSIERISASPPSLAPVVE